MLAADSMDYAKFDKFVNKAAQIMPHTPSNLFVIAKKYLSFHKDQKAFSYLAQSLELGFIRNNLTDSTTKAQLAPFSKSKQWQQFEKTMPEIIKNYQKNINLYCYTKINELVANDQYIRTNVAIMNGKTIYSHILKVDSITFENIKPMIEKYGMPTYKTVGQQGMDNLFILLLHLSLYPKYWSYLEPLFMAHFKNGAIVPNEYAIMIDRLRVWEEKKLQLYGTFNSSKDLNEGRLSPIEDIAHVDKRRFEIGLMSLEQYIDMRNKNGDYRIAYPENYKPLPIEQCQCSCGN